MRIKQIYEKVVTEKDGKYVTLARLELKDVYRYPSVRPIADNSSTLSTNSGPR